MSVLVGGSRENRWPWGDPGAEERRFAEPGGGKGFSRANRYPDRSSRSPAFPPLEMDDDL